MRVDGYAQDVLRKLTRLDRPAILMGHSMGGIAVHKAAEQAHLKALILLASVGPGQLGAIRDRLPTDKPFMFSPEQARKTWFHNIDDQSFDAIYRQLVPESVSVMNHYSSGELTIDRPKIRCPIFAIGAQHDRTVVHHAKSITDFYGGDHLMVADAGHDFMLEPAAIDVAIGINYWLLSALPDDGLQLSKA